MCFKKLIQTGIDSGEPGGCDHKVGFLKFLESTPKQVNNKCMNVYIHYWTKETSFQINKHMLGLH